MECSLFCSLEAVRDGLYEFDLYEYRWLLAGFGLTDATVRKIYREAALKILQRQP